MISKYPSMFPLIFSSLCTHKISPVCSILPAFIFLQVCTNLMTCVRAHSLEGTLEPSFHTLFHHSCYFYSTSSSPLLLKRRSRHSMDTVSEFHAEAPQATVSEGLTQGPYVVARVGVEPMTLRTKDIDSTNVPPHPTKQSS